ATARFFADLKSSVQLVADIALPPPKPHGGRKALAGRRDFLGSGAQDLPSRLMMLAAVRSVFTSEMISSRPRATSMALPGLPEPEQTSAAVAIPSPISSLARTRASEVLTVVSRLMASMVAPFGATHACCAGEVERNVSNLVAHLAQAGSHSDLLTRAVP